MLFLIAGLKFKLLFIKEDNMNILKNKFYLNTDLFKKINSIIFSFFIFMPSILLPIKILTDSGLSVYIVTAFLILISIILNINKFKIKLLIYFISIIFIYSVYYFSFLNDYMITINMLINFLKLGFLPFYLSFYVEDFKSTHDYFYKFSILNFIIIFSVFLSNKFLYDDFFNKGFSSYMSFSNTLLITSVVFFSHFLEKYRIRDLILYLIPLLTILFLGARGTFLAIIVSSIMLFFNSKKIKIRNKIIIAVFFLLFIVIIILNSYYIFEGLDNILNNHNINSRTVGSILEFIEKKNINRLSSGRIYIYKNALRLISEKPFFGGGFGYFSKNISRYPYVHNIFLEILLQFGVFGLSIFLLIFFFMIIRLLRSNKYYLKTIFIILFFTSITRLSLSGTFWTSINFWAALGLVLGYKTQKYRIMRE